jgi:hypothetical protein
MSVIFINPYSFKSRSIIADHTFGADVFSYPSAENLSVGTAGLEHFGIGFDLQGSEAYLEVLHVPSLSVVNDIPSTSTVAIDPVIVPSVDPYADPTAAGFTFDGDPFPIPEDGYSIGIAGDEHFGIAFDLDGNEAIIDPIHTLSLSVM